MANDLDDILFILAYSHNVNYSGEGFFLPSSIENVVLNLSRIKGCSKRLAKSKVNEFLSTYKDVTEVIEYNSKHLSRYPHSQVRRKCYSYEDVISIKDTEKDIVFHNMGLAKSIYDNYQPDCENLYKELIPEVRNVAGLLFLYMMKYISELNSIEGKSSAIITSLILEDFDLDKQLIEKLAGSYDYFEHLSYAIEQAFFTDNIFSDPRSFLYINAHNFNSNTCYLTKTMYLHPELSKFLYDKLRELPLEHAIKQSYSLLISEFEKKFGTPVFKSKDRLFCLLSQIYPKLINREYIFTFTVSDYEWELTSLCNMGAIYIKDDNIKVKDKERLKAVYREKEEKETSRTKSILEDFINKWLYTKATILNNEIFIDKKIPPKPESKPKNETKNNLTTEISPHVEVASKNEDTTYANSVENQTNVDKDKLRVFLGYTDDNEQVFWEPGKLLNGHSIIVGSSGAGKTETIRCLASELARQDFPVLLIDFHGDMSFQGCDITTYDIEETTPYYFNPLELNSKFKDNTRNKVIYDFMDTISINYPQIGNQQKSGFIDIIKDAYDEFGITDNPETWNNELPFEYILEGLKKKDASLMGHIRKIFDFNLFSGSKKISIENIFSNKVTHFNLKPLPESIRFIYADLLLRKVFYTLQSLGEIPRGNIKDKDKFRLFVFVDETKLLLEKKQEEKAVLNKYATEIRKYGVGLILASQIITHFDDEILNNVATKLCMRPGNKKEAQRNSKFFNVKEETLLNLSQGKGILLTSQKDGIDNIKKLQIVPSWERSWLKN